MLVKFGKQERPKKIEIDEAHSSASTTRFIAEPFERVFGHSVGNALRRVLLSSLEAPGIIAFRIEGVPHEFMAIEGIVEDVTTIVLNMKGALLRCLPSQENEVTRETRFVTTVVDVTEQMLHKEGGKHVVTFGEIFKDPVFEVINPDHVVFTITKPMKRQIDLRVGFGRGYVSSERHVIQNKLQDEIVIDTTFAPVTHVNYFVENTRVGQDTDYDRLVLDVTTDGRLTPVEALTFSAQILMRNLEIFNQIKVHDIDFEQNSSETSDDDKLLDMLGLRIDEIELSVRSTNCLSSANIDTIAELVCLPEKKMLEFRNFGKKSLNEIKAKLSEMGLSLGMDLARFGIDFSNVKDRIRELSDEKKVKKEKRK